MGNLKNEVFEGYIKCPAGGGLCRWGASLYGSSVRETWRGVLVGDPEGYERRALGTGSSLYGGSAGATCGWAHLLGLKDMAEGALEMVCLSPWELCEGNLVVAPSRGP